MVREEHIFDWSPHRLGGFTVTKFYPLTKSKTLTVEVLHALNARNFTAPRIRIYINTVSGYVIYANICKSLYLSGIILRRYRCPLSVAGFFSPVKKAHRSEPLRHAIFVISMLQCRVPPGESLAGYTVTRVANKQLFPLRTSYAPPHRGDSLQPQ